MVELFLAMEKVACSSHVLRSICDYGLKAMILGFQPSGLGSIPSSRSNARLTQMVEWFPYKE